MSHALFGKLTTAALKHDPIEYGAGVSMGVVALFLIIYITYKKRWGHLWKNWFCSVDAKKIGVMYFIVAALMLVKGLIDALMMRAQQAMAAGNAGYLGAELFQQIFTAHGTTMIFFVGMGVVFALFNLVIPLQIGARDVAFPFLNSLSFWLFAMGALFVNLSLVLGNFGGAGWLSYPPLANLAYSPDVGVDYWIWSVQIAGLGSLFSGINFLVTILRMRCPGMTMMKMPIFVWSCLGSITLIIFAFPILTATLAMLSFDRLMGMHFFTSDFGGSPMLYINLIWAWGHPEVYILILPIFGVYSEVIATFSKKGLFGYTSMVWAVVGIAFLSFIVWLHHFFTMGAPPGTNSFFAIMTMAVAIPTGVKVFNWLFTSCRGRLTFSTPMLWFLAFILIFTIGGLAGVLLSIPPIDFQVHNSLFLVAHFHSVIIGGVLFGFFSALAYWFPKVTGFCLDEKWGRAAFWLWFLGFMVAFMPLYALGLMGATRRLNTYAAETGWQPFFMIAALGGLIITLAIGCQLIQVLVSIKNRDKLRDTTGDPWDGRTLEWSISSPPPFYNFAVTPEVHERDAWWAMKQKPQGKPVYKDVHMPIDSPMGLLIALCGFVACFALIWQIFWLVPVAFLGIFVLAICRLSKDEVEYTLTAREIERYESDRQKS
ncbi:MAG: cbb3-type cytochrome c oxidase subunit I [Chlamydiae bacterium]|nr:cbb3-type cytochrome c oxidase subunit I [Chlamydiota bacterium]